MIKQLNEYKSAAGIYKIVNKVNGKIYIGQTNNFEKRAYDHEYKLKTNKHINKHLQNAWNQCGPEAFEFSVISVIENAEERTMAEQMWIDVVYGEDCYNLEKKAQLRPVDVYEKISRANVGKPSAKKGVPMSEEQKQKISEGKRGKPSTFKGKTHSEASKQKLREAKLGKTLSEATKQKMREAALRQWDAYYKLTPIAPESAALPVPILTVTKASP